MFDWLIVGAGFAGSVLAERLANELGDLVLLIDRRSHVGGNSYDRFDGTGSLIPVYGQHILNTKNARVLEYLSRFTRWRCRTNSDSGSGERELLESLGGPTDEYASHGSGRGAAADSSAARHAHPASVHIAWDTEALDFVDVSVEHLGDLAGEALLPAEGYARMFEAMLTSHSIKIMLNTDYADIRDIIPFRRLIYTGSLDEYFDYCYGRLPYKAGVADERGFPLADAGGDGLFRRYGELAQATTGVFFIGRLATYRYTPMGEAVSDALDLFDLIKSAEEASTPLGRLDRAGK